MSTVALPAGWTLAAFDAVDSTNDEAISRAEQGAAEGTVVWGRQQLAGRGRRGRNWQSPPGNMYASVIVRPNCPPGQAAQLGFVTAIAVGETAASLLPAGHRITYKWPNDVQVDGGKIAGILLESAPGADGNVDYVVIGTGINVAWQPRQAEIPYPVASLAELRVTATVEQVLELYLSHLAHWIGIWRRKGFAVVREAWLSRAGNLGQTVGVKTGAETCYGRFAGIDDAGSLIVELEDGTMRYMNAGEVLPTSH